MAIAPLERRLDQALENVDQSVQIAETQPTEALSILPPSPPEEEPSVTQVAGLFGKISGQAAEAADSFVTRKVREARAKTKIGPPPAPPLSPEAQIAQEADDAAKSAVNLGLGTKAEAGVATKIEAERKLKPGLTPQDVAASREAAIARRAAQPTPAPEMEKPPAKPFNLTTIDSEEAFKAFVDDFAQKGGVSYEKITLKDVAAKARESGASPAFIDSVLKGELRVNPVEIVKAMDVHLAALKSAEPILQKIARNQATPEEVAEAAQLVYLSSALQDATKGITSSLGQALAVLRIPRSGDTNLREIIDTFGTDKDIKKFAQAYLDSPTMKGKAELVAGMTKVSIWEKLAFIYTGNLLLGAGTVAKAALSSALFTGLRIGERGVAAGIGSVRTGFRSAFGLDPQDAYRFKEVTEMLAATGQGIRDGWDLAIHAFTKGYPADWVDPDKIGRMKSRMELFKRGDPRFWNPEGSLTDAGLWALNGLITLPYRSIIGTDQFFRGIASRQELAALQAREGLRAYDEADRAIHAKANNAARNAGQKVLDGGGTDNDANVAAAKAFEDYLSKIDINAEREKAASNAIDQIAKSPPEAVAEAGLTVSMSNDIKGKLGTIVAQMTPDTPGMFALRTQIPFISTPINSMIATIERTPLALLKDPKTIMNGLLLRGSKEGDMALAKVGTGGAATYMFVSAAENGYLTGAGPKDKGQREAAIRQGWQPYSLVIDISMFRGDRKLEESVRQKLSALPLAVSYGSGDYRDKIFISYQGLEPVGALLAMSSDYVDYVKYEQDDSRVQSFAAAMTFGIANYIMENPMLTGVQNIAKFLREDQNGGVNLPNLLDELGKVSGTVAFDMVPGQRPMRFAAQVSDPYVRAYNLTPNAPPGLKGLMDALNKFRAETPWLSDDMPVMPNLWGEPRMHEYAWSPLRTKEGTRRRADQGLYQLNNRARMPSFEVSSNVPELNVRGAKTKLDAWEYLELMRIANKELKLEDRINAQLDLMEGANLKDEGALLFYQNEMDKVITKTFEEAKHILVRDSRYSDQINRRLYEHARELSQRGQGAR